ncbi:MAG: DinB family protein [Bacteroidota bacterium]|jgi:hypothetical protein
MIFNECQTLSSIIDDTRKLTLSFLSQLEDSNGFYNDFKLDDKHLNSAFWIMAHLSVTQNFLLLRSTGGETIKIPYARQFGMGAVPPSREECPSLEEVRSIFNLVHEKSVKHIQNLDPSQLNQINTTGFVFLGEDSIRSVIVHAIRHENMHSGHLSWLCKLNGLKTI